MQRMRLAGHGLGDEAKIITQSSSDCLCCVVCAFIIGVCCVLCAVCCAVCCVLCAIIAVCCVL
jgi:hypothetical protein